MGYMENSYSNSNNGGSVNSQDSLYQMKMSAAGNANLISQQYVEHQPSYGYDPLTHGGYGTVDDYATYPQQMLVGDDYHNQMMMAQQPPSRQDYCTDPYAAVHKPNKKRLDSHMGKYIIYKLIPHLQNHNYFNLYPQNRHIMMLAASPIHIWNR
jgi:echinoid